MSNKNRRHTKTQQMVLEYFEQTDGAVSHEMVEKSLGNQMNRVTIYRILNRFEEDGVVHKIVGDDGVSYYARCENSCDHNHHRDNHVHFRCEKCNSISCLEQTISVDLPENFQMTNMNFLVTGVCALCAKD